MQRSVRGVAGVCVPPQAQRREADDLPTAALTVPALATISINLTVRAHKLALEDVTLIKGEDGAEVNAGTHVLRVVHSRQDVDEPIGPGVA